MVNLNMEILYIEIQNDEYRCWSDFHDGRVCICPKEEVGEGHSSFFIDKD